MFYRVVAALVASTCVESLLIKGATQQDSAESKKKLDADLTAVADVADADKATDVVAADVADGAAVAVDVDADFRDAVDVVAGATTGA